jgi:hypothetical protein
VRNRHHAGRRVAVERAADRYTLICDEPEDLVDKMAQYAAAGIPAYLVVRMSVDGGIIDAREFHLDAATYQYRVETLGGPPRPFHGKLVEYGAGKLVRWSAGPLPLQRPHGLGEFFQAEDDQPKRRGHRPVVFQQDS